MTTLFWCLEYGKVLFAYLIIMFVWPQIMFRRFLRGKSLTFQFGFCTTIQVVLVNTVVLGLGLLHILKPWIFCLLFYGSALFVVGRKIQWKEKVMKTIHKLFAKTYGPKLFLSDCMMRFRRRWKNVRKIVSAKLHGHVFECILLAVVVLFGVIYFSYGAFQDYSYGFGDMYPHNAWIYGLSNGEIFSSGVYPEGMHCFEYAMHTLFSIRIYSCLLFTAGIHSAVFLLSAYLLLKEVFRWRYTAIAALALFLTVDLMCVNEVYSMSRLQWTLPQEFALYSVFLCAAFLIRYIKSDAQHPKEQENKTYKKWQKLLLADKLNYNEDLLVFMMALAVSIIVHFYATIMAFFLCIAFVPVMLKKILKPRNFGALAVSVILGCLIAILPMAGALASGIPFQGSIGWAVNVINGTDGQDSGAIIIDEETGEEITGSISFSGNQSDNSKQPENNSGDLTDGSGDEIPQTPAERDPLLTRIKNLIVEKAQTVYQRSYVTLYCQSRAKLLIIFTLLSLGIFLAGKITLSIIGVVKKQKADTGFDHYLSLIVTTIIFMIMYDATSLGLPSLIAGSRLCAITQLFNLAMCCIPADAVCYLLSLFVNTAVMKTIAFVGVAAIYVTTKMTGTFHGYLYYELTRYNSAVMSTYAITKDLPENSFTIVSPVDELYQVIGYGFHEELVVFINECVKQNYSIPTEYVFIFVEKHPLHYAQNHFFSGPGWLAEEKYDQYYGETASKCPEVINSVISDLLAVPPFYEFPLNSQCYSHLNMRMIIESRASKWCKQFNKLYPGELHTYYEDDDFVCYYFKQNPACLYQLGFDLN